MPESSQADQRMMRPPVRTIAQIPADLREQLDAYAAANYRSVSSVVVAAVARYLRREAETDGR